VPYYNDIANPASKDRNNERRKNPVSASVQNYIEADWTLSLYPANDAL
jgi:hypothetical protein